jgi:hypothetical protein
MITHDTSRRLQYWKPLRHAYSAQHHLATKQLSREGIGVGRHIHKTSRARVNLRNDGKDVSGWDPSAFDAAFIHTSCGSGVRYDDNLKAWYCNSQALAGSRMIRGAMTRLSAAAAPVED